MHSAMKTQVLFGLTLTFLFSGVLSATVTISNNCTYTIWPGTLTGNGGAQLSTTGFELTSGASSSINVPAPFTGRFWARTECSTASGNFTCATADCATGQVACNGASAVPPASLAEFDLAASGGQDFYDISLVDGFNLPLTITPQPQGGSGPTCPVTSCAANINAVCPTELQVKGSDGSVIGCKSACDAFNQPQYCCTGAYSSPATCPPTNYSQFFRNECPQAYSYAYDDQTSTLACTGSPNYVITFCP